MLISRDVEDLEGAVTIIFVSNELDPSFVLLYKFHLVKKGMHFFFVVVGIKFTSLNAMWSTLSFHLELNELCK